MTATVRHVEVTRFVVAVREALQDLAPEEVDELTDDLEADLDDALADASTEGVDRLGSPQEYADELRAAAGLPPRAEPGGRRGAVVLLARVSRLVQAFGDALDRIRAQRWWPGLRDFVLTLAPVWWVIRGWVAFQAVLVMTGRSLSRWVPLTFGGWVLLCLLSAVSVELGRRRFATRGLRGRVLFAVANAAVLVALGPLADHASAPVEIYTNSSVPPPNGLWLNGTEVRNVFPYDSSGHPLADVQLVDERGRLLEVGDSARTALLVQDRYGNPEPAPGDETGNLVLASAQVPAVDANNQQLWNVFPLRQQVVQQDNTGSGASKSLSPPTEPKAPLQTLLPVAPPGAGAADPPSPSPSSVGSAPSP